MNTKQVHSFSSAAENHRLLDLLLKEDCIIEKWIPKATFNGVTYDLRVVYQLGKIAFVVPRGANSPITNLHLNDRPLNLTEIDLSESLWQKINILAQRAMACFPELTYAGLDILIPAGDKQEVSPLIIEVNGQGDLIYKDIFNENQIYREQAAYLASLKK